MNKDFKLLAWKKVYLELLQELDNSALGLKFLSLLDQLDKILEEEK